MQSFLKSSQINCQLTGGISLYLRVFVLLVLLLMLLFVGNTAYAAIDVRQSHPIALGESAQYFQEGAHRMDLADAQERMSKEGLRSHEPILSFGINANPIWLKFEFTNSADQPAQRFLRFETSWLDRIELFFVVDGKLTREEKGGDYYPFQAREQNDRFVVFSHDYLPGSTGVYVRVESQDPLIIPMYLYKSDELVANKVNQGYVYGLIYGFLAALLAYNALLAFSLKSRRYLFYAQYLFGFLLMNASYTGHAFQWLWPELMHWQLWSNPILMMVYVVSGLLFATRFLETRAYLPRLHRFISIYCSGLSLIAIACVLLGDNVVLLYAAFIGIIPFSVLMILSGALALASGMKAAKFFLAATIFATLGAVYSAFTVAGVVSYSALGFHAVEIGMLVEAVLFALALSYQFKINQEAKVHAERLADIDQLTGLYNRRGFDKISSAIFSTAQRKERQLSLLLLDLDHFKLINDQYGHLVGDEVLRQLSDLLLEDARTGDLVARWGGEEFIFLLPETNLAEAHSLAERLVRKTAELTVVFKRQEVRFTVSIGVAALNAEHKTFSMLLDKADHALYKAKAEGRNQVCE